MMQFKINGEELDLYEGLALTFKKSNILLSFDNIECERTASFSVPATPRNDAIFGLAKDYHYTGEAMRIKHTSQMVDGTIVKDGQLYITDYKGGSYDCVFVFGDNLLLKRVKDAGGINTYLNNASIVSESVPWSVTFDTEARNMGTAVYYNYWTGEANVMRSWRAPHPYAKFSYLLEKAAQRQGVTLSNVPSGVYSIYFVLNGELFAGVRQHAVFGQNIPLYANLPSWTLLDMLKIAAYLTGTLLIAEGNTVRFVSSNAMPITDITDRVLSIGKMARTVGNYAQVNTVQYDKGEEMLASYGAVDPVIQDFEIYNANIDADKVLYKLPNIVKPETLPQTDYNGVISSVKNRNYVYGATPSYEVDYWEKEYLFATASTITSGSQAGKIGLKELSLTLGGGYEFLAHIFAKSTQLEVSVKMSHLEFEELTPDTLLHLNGSDFAWYEAKYSNGVATLTLCQI